MMSEFALIDRYFKRPATRSVLGIGDDGAMIQPSPGMALVISTDMLVEGTHFFADATPEDLGWKTLAVNLSDLAAMGAAPRWALLAAALPTIDEPWIAAFAQGFFACADRFDIDVIGGDTTRGPRNFCVTIFGETPHGQALLRSGARVGDELWVSGSPGLAAIGLACLRQHCVLDDAPRHACLAALHRPQPRVALGLALRGVASAAIDVSDGLLGDLGHLLSASKLAATIYVEQLPRAAFDTGVDPALARNCLLAGGDDYELLFTASAARHAEILALGGQLQLPLTQVGHLLSGAPGDITLLDSTGSSVPITQRGYDHFN
jgi:thiamine-monophosphate kinase